MKVFVVCIGDFDCSNLFGIYSSMEKAEERRLELQQDWVERVGKPMKLEHVASIVEIEVDEDTNISLY